MTISVTIGESGFDSASTFFVDGEWSVAAAVGLMHVNSEELQAVLGLSNGCSDF